jgi:PIN domain nuclease of toxin-antitoxin system
MRLLLDTHIVLAFLHNRFDRLFPDFHRFFVNNDIEAFVSIASIWEIAIKSNLGKLDAGLPLQEISGALAASRLGILSIEIAHVITAVAPEPTTRDPFDRLLLAQCAVEGLQLVTIDRALVEHPLAFRF